MKCIKCPYYECSPCFNKCNLLKWECCHENNNCLIVNEDGSINEDEYKKVEKYIW